MGNLSPALKGHIAVFLFSALVAGSFSLGAQVADEIAPAAITAVRFAAASVIIGFAVILTGGAPRTAWQAPWRYLVLGGLFATYFVLMFEGLKTAQPVGAAAVFTLMPIMSAGFGYLLLRQILTRHMALALAVGATGAAWVIFRGDLGLFLRMQIGQGEMIYLVGCVFHAVYTPMVAKLNRGERPVVFSFGTLIAGTIVLVAYGWSDILATDWGSLRPLVWVTIVYITVFASAASFVLLQYASLRLPAAKVMAYTYLTPSWVICWELALGNGAPPLNVFVGIGLTVVALLMLLDHDEAPIKVSDGSK